MTKTEARARVIEARQDLRDKLDLARTDWWAGAGLAIQAARQELARAKREEEAAAVIV